MGRRQPDAETDPGVYETHNIDIVLEGVELRGIFNFPLFVYTLQRSAVQAIEVCVIRSWAFVYFRIVNHLPEKAMGPDIIGRSFGPLLAGRRDGLGSCL